jgi:hypothetical protein
MRSEVKCANCGITEWTDSGRVVFVPREGVDFGGKWIHGTSCDPQLTGDEVPVDELLQLQKRADWERALNEYSQLREEIGRLEEQGECGCDPNDFHTCELCKETSALDGRAVTLMSLWGDTWAMKLAISKELTK